MLRVIRPEQRVLTIGNPGLHIESASAVAPALHLTATTTSSPQTVTIQRLTPSVDTTIDWGDGSAPVTIVAGFAGTLTRSYATPGTYPIRVANADALTHVDIRVPQIGGLNTADLAGATLVYFRASGMGAGCVIRSGAHDFSVAAMQPDGDVITLVRAHWMSAAAHKGAA